MAKYELMQKNEINGDVWYFIRKDGGFSVEQSWTLSLEKAEKMLEQLQNTKNSEPIFKVLKTIEVNED
jgi:hypothetical protein